MVGFLITEVEEQDRPGSGSKDLVPVTDDIHALGSTTSPASSISARVAAEKAKSDASVALPMISIFRVEDAELPAEANTDTVGFAPAPLPSTIPMDKVMTNIVQNLDFKAWSEHARAMWFKDFKSPPSRAVMNDTFWYCICWYFKAGKHIDVEKRLFDRISANFVFLFESVAPTRKDFFFRFYADAAAQAVLYAMFLAYPKSRVNFTEKFRRGLVDRISYWSTGICPEFVDTSHWKLNLGGGDVLQATTSPAWQRSAAEGARRLAADPRPALRRLSRWQKSFPSAPRTQAVPNPPLFAVGGALPEDPEVLLGELRATLADGPDQRGGEVKIMDVKHAMLVERASMAREHCEQLNSEYADLCSEVKRQERQRQAQAQAGKKRLEIRRKEVLRSDPHEYANYLVSLHLLQQGL
eukprot:CAMPEP_0115376972 /NCGR_PEP_ID=MMETSP0271-20121206/3250_1 /TAXON_ID=71861 /ORGANISM="Scrippsiella trochoidea, Strain CCMP3099" /LENGTH=410 /DNA_ID=CAMNT_0002800077 /DNA_START=53 /DNA_END=1282 /DNA_ORIENTATION=-